VEIYLIFHKGYSLPLDRPGNNHGRTFLLGFEQSHGPVNVVKIMAVNFNGVPPEETFDSDGKKSTTKPSLSACTMARLTGSTIPSTRQ